jgi:UDP-glucose 4-epimerase
MAILVTGGAGYIGSVAAHALVEAGHEVIVVDNLSKGVRHLVPEKATFYNQDLCDFKALKDVFKKHRIKSVMHFAAYKAVGESMTNPIKYSDNIKGTLNLMELVAAFKVKRIIYSSTAAIYGMPDMDVISEDTPSKPINYYGYTKMVCGDIIRWYHERYGISYTSLCYFNVAGDAGLNYIDPEAENILPILMEVVKGMRGKFTVYGDDYDTPDGTCIRDYIDVRDLVKAHILALESDFNGKINLGTSKGTSVKEFVDVTKKVTGKDFKVEVGPKRPGDPGTLIASNEKAKKVLGWKPVHSVHDMIKTAFDAYSTSS